MGKKKKRKRHTGVLSKYRRGFGFVSCDELEKDIFISSDSLHGAMNGDKVEVDLIPEYLWRQSPEGIVTKVLERKTTEVVGVFDKSRNYAFVIPYNKKECEDVFIRKNHFCGAKDGDNVVAKITRYPDKGHKAEGIITEIISSGSESGGDIRAMARSFGMIETFPSDVNREAKLVSRSGVTDEDIRGRRDLRDKKIFTIDGEHSRDFDDAVSIELLENGDYLLGVHIADVTHYVSQNSELDKEALKRGTSVYLIDQVIPMLPKRLSNGICSLNPGEDRLTLSIDMQITPDGTVVSHEIYESVIRSCARLVYTDVSDLIEKNSREAAEKCEGVTDDLFMMHNLAVRLSKVRRERGSIDFDMDEAEIILDEKGRPVDVRIAERRTANKLIEEFMLLANETVAEHFYWMEVPFIFRVHEKPEAERMEELKIFLNSLGILLRGDTGSVHPRAISQILESVKGRSSEVVVNTVTLRSMQKAFYSTTCEGHFGLSARYYCHFTSPIRRYPDLMIHRLIKYYISGGITEGRLSKIRKRAEYAAEQSSLMERKAVDVERRVEKMKKTEYMSGRIGEISDGVISGVTEFGIYVQLPDTVEGLVHVENLNDDFYEYDRKKYVLRGRHSGKIYKLGDEITVRVHSVDLGRSEINFSIWKR